MLFLFHFMYKWKYSKIILNLSMNWGWFILSLIYSSIITFAGHTISYYYLWALKTCTKLMQAAYKIWQYIHFEYVYFTYIQSLNKYYSIYIWTRMRCVFHVQFNDEYQKEKFIYLFNSLIKHQKLCVFFFHVNYLIIIIKTLLIILFFSLNFIRQ